EKLDVTTVIFANRSYAILHGELLNVGAVPGLNTRTMFDLENPLLDWVQMANGMGVEAAMADTAETFHRALEKGLETNEPFLIQANL
ncbi:MAG: thiamine pyrophosphate-dependent enzyme, partial [Chloroflexota bacterium]|nr:thiamine pyrophosphate-dependent enzyme [Chloroflexota bacterium]